MKNNTINYLDTQLQNKTRGKSKKVQQEEINWIKVYKYTDDEYKNLKEEGRLKLLISVIQQKQTRKDLDINVMEKIVKYYPFFQHIYTCYGHNVLRKFLQICQYQKKNQDEVIYYQDDLIDNYYILVSGKVSASQNIIDPVLKRTYNNSRFWHYLGVKQANIIISTNFFSSTNEINIKNRCKDFGRVDMNNLATRQMTYSAQQSSEFLYISQSNYIQIFHSFHENELNTRLNQLKKFPCFEVLHERNLIRISDFFTEENYIRNQQVYRQGENSEQVYFILNGEFQISKGIYMKALSSAIKNSQDKYGIYMFQKGNLKYEVAVLSSQEWFGEEELLDNLQQRQVSVTCISEKATVLSINKKVFKIYLLLYNAKSKLILSLIKDFEKRISKEAPFMEQLIRTLNIKKRYRNKRDRELKKLASTSQEVDLYITNPAKFRSIRTPESNNKINIQEIKQITQEDQENIGFEGKQKLSNDKIYETPEEFLDMLKQLSLNQLYSMYYKGANHSGIEIYNQLKLQKQHNSSKQANNNKNSPFKSLKKDIANQFSPNKRYQDTENSTIQSLNVSPHKKKKIINVRFWEENVQQEKFEEKQKQIILKEKQAKQSMKKKIRSLTTNTSPTTADNKKNKKLFKTNKDPITSMMNDTALMFKTNYQQFQHVLVEKKHEQMLQNQQQGIRISAEECHELWRSQDFIEPNSVRNLVSSKHKLLKKFNQKFTSNSTIPQIINEKETNMLMKLKKLRWEEQHGLRKDKLNFDNRSGKKREDLCLNHISEKLFRLQNEQDLYQTGTQLAKVNENQTTQGSPRALSNFQHLNMHTAINKSKNQNPYLHTKRSYSQNTQQSAVIFDPKNSYQFKQRNSSNGGISQERETNIIQQIKSINFNSNRDIGFQLNSISKTLDSAKKSNQKKYNFF